MKNGSFTKKKKIPGNPTKRSSNIWRETLNDGDSSSKMKGHKCLQSYPLIFELRELFARLFPQRAVIKV